MIENKIPKPKPNPNLMTIDYKIPNLILILTLTTLLVLTYPTDRNQTNSNHILLLIVRKVFYHTGLPPI